MAQGIALTEERKGEVVNFYLNSDANLKEVAAHFGISKDTVSRLMNARGISPKPQKFEDLTGQVFRSWTVIGPSLEPHRLKRWVCECECGLRRIVTSKDLKHKKSTRCTSCYYKTRVTDHAGERYGALVVLSLAEKRTKSGGTYWLCQCDCGAKKVVMLQSLLKDKNPTRSCGAKFHSSQWKGGRIKTSGGYIQVWAKGHPHSTRDGRMMEHRLVMENAIGRYLKPEETVHHINGIKDDNRIENLELWDSAHCPGQRVSEKIAFAIEYLESHGYTVTPPNKLK